MYVTKHIDWLSITFPTDTNLQSIFSTLDWRYIGKGKHGYKFAYRDQITGAIYQEGGNVDDMGVHLTLSGDCLNMLRSERGGQDDSLAVLVTSQSGYASRIDLTLNIHEGQLTPRKLYNAYKAGNLTAKTKRGRFIEGINGDVSGDTLYLGSPKSDRQFRGYNKAAELGVVDDGAWLRLELELRNLRAQGALASCADNGVPATVSGHMAQFLQFDNAEFRQALSGPTVEPRDIPRKQTNRQRWLLGQVAQALAKECIEDYSFRQLFDNAVQSNIDKELN